MSTWEISEAELAAWCRGVLAKYSPADVGLFIIRLKRTYDTRLRAV